MCPCVYVCVWTGGRAGAPPSVRVCMCVCGVQQGLGALGRQPGRELSTLTGAGTNQSPLHYKAQSGRGRRRGPGGRAGSAPSNTGRRQLTWPGPSTGLAAANWPPAGTRRHPTGDQTRQPNQLNTTHARTAGRFATSGGNKSVTELKFYQSVALKLTTTG